MVVYAGIIAKLRDAKFFSTLLLQFVEHFMEFVGRDGIRRRIFVVEIFLRIVSI